jgi:hypothetical protein
MERLDNSEPGIVGIGIGNKHGPGSDGYPVTQLDGAAAVIVDETNPHINESLHAYIDA